MKFKLEWSKKGERLKDMAIGFLSVYIGFMLSALIVFLTKFHSFIFLFTTGIIFSIVILYRLEAIWIIRE